MKLKIATVCVLMCVMAVAVFAQAGDPVSGKWTGDWGPSAADRNQVVVGPRASLARHRIALGDMVVYRSAHDALDVRIRHHGRPLRGRLLMTGDATGELVLEDAAEAVAPGQTAALYDEGRLVAAGTIVRAQAGRVTTED